MLARDEGHFRQPRVYIAAEVCDPNLAALDERRDLRVVTRPALGAALRTPSITAAKPSSSTRRSQIVTKALSFGVVPSNGAAG